MSEPTTGESTCIDSDFAMVKAACGCTIPSYMLYTNGRAECYNCQPVATGGTAA